MPELYDEAPTIISEKPSPFTSPAEETDIPKADLIVSEVNIIELSSELLKIVFPFSSSNPFDL